MQKLQQHTAVSASRFRSTKAKFSARQVVQLPEQWTSTVPLETSVRASVEAEITAVRAATTVAVRAATIATAAIRLPEKEAHANAYS